MKETTTEAENTERETSWNPSTPKSEESPANDQRSLDIGESGQFAPGGYYNQQGVNKPERIDLDDDILPAGRNE